MKKSDALQLLGLSGHVLKTDIKRAYQRKVKEFHPDRNLAGAEIMKMINIAYAVVREEDNIDVSEHADMAGYPDLLSTALSAVLNLGLTIEICGLWVWVSGETKPHKQILKKADYFWSPRKGMWYFRPKQVKSRKYWHTDKSEWSIDKIRETYGVSRPNSQGVAHTYRLGKSS